MKKQLVFVFVAGAFLANAANATFHPEVFSYSQNAYSYQNGLGENVSGNSLLVKGVPLEWLPLNFTTNYSFQEISNLIQKGNRFEGWRLANEEEINMMLGVYFSDVLLDLSDGSNRPEINGAFTSYYPFFGDTYSPLVTEPSWWEYGFGYAIGFFEPTNDPEPQCASALIFSDAHYNIEPTYLYGDVLYVMHGYVMYEKYDSIGSYLVRPAPVPEPSTSAMLVAALALIWSRHRRLRSHAQ